MAKQDRACGAVVTRSVRAALLNDEEVDADALSITSETHLHPGLEAASIEWPWKYLQYLDDTVSIGRRVVTNDPGRKPLQFKHARIMVKRL